MLRIKQLHDHVARARAKLERLSVHDDLTGLFNYRYLHNRLSEEFKRAERYHDPLACIVVDVDRLQAINDLAGRELGDRVLAAVAEVLLRSVRDVDVVARFGGDEFLIILPSTHFAGSVTVAERIWREVGDASFAVGEKQIAKVTLSLGVALFPSRDVRSKDALLRAADAALHQAKRDGGNRLCVFQQQGYLYTPMAGSPTLEITSGVGDARVATNALPQNLPVFNPQREAIPTLRPDNSAAISGENDHVVVEIGVPDLLNSSDVTLGTDRRNNS
jgi:diguanylate cyclase (GGDEF)-like protein